MRLIFLFTKNSRRSRTRGILTGEMGLKAFGLVISISEIGCDFWREIIRITI